MINDINREQVTDMKEKGAQLVEVLSSQDYQEEHLQGAISLPLAELDARTSQKLDRSRPIIVYCHDYE